MGCACGRSLHGPQSQKLAELWADDDVPESGEAVPQLEQTMWTMYGGDELEGPLKEGLVKLVRASWLIDLDRYGGVLRRRQELPRKAFIGLDELKAAGPFNKWWAHWLPIVVLSYPWLQPGHPDPHGESLHVVAKALKRYVDYDRGKQPYGVLIDFTALFQVERTEEENKLFKRALPELNLFYSHPHTVVLKVTGFPAGYPNGAHEYILPPGANTVKYDDRGWCFAESAMSSLVKSSSEVIDLGHWRDGDGLERMLDRCKSGRAPPLHPVDFKAKLDTKTFTSKSADFERVAKLYADAFQKRLGEARDLKYVGLGWGADEVRKLARALHTNGTLKTLQLSFNQMGSEGAVALAEVLNSTRLQELSLMGNNIGDEGVVALAKALRNNSTLREVNLFDNRVGDEGAAALAEALLHNSTLEKLFLLQNNIGAAGKAALAEARAAGRVSD